LKYCKRCLYPENHPLNIVFDEKGICSGCRIHEEKDSINWDVQEKKLKNILNSYKNENKKNYDCIIPVSGGRDSYFIVHTIKKVYGLNPLLVTYNKHYNTKVGIRNLAYLRTIFDCDILTMTVDPEKVKKITRVTLNKFGSIYWHCIAGQTVFPVQIAVRLKIPLIIWGAHQGCDQVGMFSHLDEVEMTRKYRKEHDLMSFESEDLIENSMNLTKEDLEPFKYPYDKEIEQIGVRGIYLNNYIRWDTKKQHEDMIEAYNYKTIKQVRTFDSYNDVDSFHYSDLHDYIKFLKYGYGKITDHATREIRLKRLTREEGTNLVKEYQNKPPKNIKMFLKWLGITENGFYYFINKHRDPKIWEKNIKGDWVLKDNIIHHLNEEGIEESRLEKKEDCKFTLTPLHDEEKDDEEEYTLIGKGYIEDDIE
jgi:N-acetyl sugar amidotransferase